MCLKKKPAVTNDNEISITTAFFMPLKILDDMLLRFSPPKITNTKNKYMYSLPLRKSAPIIIKSANIKFTAAFMYFCFTGLNAPEIVDLPVSISHMREPVKAKAYGSNFSVAAAFSASGKKLAAARPISAWVCPFIFSPYLKYFN